MKIPSTVKILVNGQWKTMVTREYRAYCSAKARCTNPTCPSYKRYGGRGIEFRFKSFQEFYTALGPKPSPKHSVDRINNEGHYELGNVRWATAKQQAQNRRRRSCGSWGRTPRRFVTFRGETKSVGEWAKQLGLKGSTVHTRVTKGWSAEEALSQRQTTRGAK